MTPTTPTPIPRVTSPIPHLRSHLSSPPSLPPTSRPPSPALSVHAQDRRHPRRPCRSDAHPLHGKSVNVAPVPFFEAGIARSGDWTGRAAASEADGPYRHLRRRRVCKEELVLSVATAADPMPEADARLESEVPNGNEEQRLGCQRGRGADASKDQLFRGLRLYSHSRRRTVRQPSRMSQSATRER